MEINRDEDEALALNRDQDSLALSKHKDLDTQGSGAAVPGVVDLGEAGININHLAQRVRVHQGHVK